jgi:hypothetical protein
VRAERALGENIFSGCGFWRHARELKDTSAVGVVR